MPKMPQRVLATPADPIIRTMAFLEEYLAAPNDADVEIRLGSMSGEPSIGISINGSMHGFTAAEARIVADCAESALHAHPSEKEAEGLPNLILALRSVADKAEQKN